MMRPFSLLGPALCASLPLVAASVHTQTPTPVRLQQGADGWTLLRDGKPYTIRGAGGQRNLEQLVAAGGNSIRTWGADGVGGVLDRAASLGISVTVGIWLGHKEHGFRYDDAARVAAQQAESLQHIDRYKNHPGLLFWALGNEMENGFDGDDVWIAVEALAKEVKKRDPNHPIMTVVAEISAAKIEKLKRLCPSVDLLGINSYGGASTLAERVKTFGWTKPYVVTEFGPLGPWEVRKTAWNAPVDISSTEKAAVYRSHYEKAVAAAPGRCLGSYAFLWDDKQEGTATWFGMFYPQTGERLGPADTMTQIWSGKPPRNRVPEIVAFSSEAAEKQIGSEGPLKVTCTLRDPENDPLQVRWEIRREDHSFVDEGAGTPTGFTARTPDKPGDYRLFLTVRDGKGGAATANFPFKVVRG